GEVGVRFDFGYRNAPLQLSSSTGKREVTVDQDAELRLNLHFGVIPHLQVGASMGIAYQQFSKTPGGLFEDGVAVGDLRLYLKAQLLRSKYVGFAAVLGVVAPTSGYSQAHGGDGVWSGEPRLILDVKVRWFGVILN